LQSEIIAAVVVSTAAFLVVLTLVPVLIRILTKHNWTVKDVNRLGGAMIPRPGGPAIIAAIIVSELIFFFAFSASDMVSKQISAVLITTSAAFMIGFVDDRKVMGGWFKPLALAVSALPIILLGAYEPTLAFPIFGEVRIPLLSMVVIVVMVSITGNTVNSIDVMNGVASGFVTIASVALTISLVIVQEYDVAIMSLPLVFASLAFYRYHKFPSRIFPGDSGALTLGAMYGTIAIVGNVEVIAAIALLPAVINSFLFLSSVKKIVEHRQIKGPTMHTDDNKITATQEKDAPITLVRLLVARRPLSEKEVGFAIFRLAAFSASLAVISAFLMGVRI
jgi:UDP-N-acetylmuramyl pentapeptide phosphotransferase/UDP-N-acetylglucosamine-1-phosphate transferase